jgi:hypothetical protein
LTNTLSVLWFGQKFEDTKGVIKSVNQRRTNNIMAKSLKIPKG